MGLTNFPFGITSFGAPVMGVTTGNVFFVDSGSTAAADTVDHGTNTTQPFATVDFAIGRTTANNGDIIYVMPGHSENITGTIAMDVAGLSVIGLGQGFTRPQIVHTGTAGTVTITASNCRWSNMIHVASIAEVVSAISISGPGTASATQHTEIDNCRFTFDATAVEFAEMLTCGDGGTDSADYLSIHDNWFEAEGIDGCGSAILLDDCQFIDIVNNRFSGDFNTPVIDADRGSSACLDFYIVGNVIENRDDGTTNIFQMEDNSTGIIAHNYFASPLADPEVHFDQGICKMIDNFGSDDAVDVGASRIPIASAT